MTMIAAEIFCYERARVGAFVTIGAAG